MTPAQQVALDAMRSAWPEETVARMLGVVEGFVWLCEEHRDYEGEDSFAICLTEEAAMEAVRARHRSFAGLPEAEVEFMRRPVDGDNLMAMADGREYWLTKMPLSGIETPARSVPAPSVCADCHVHPCACRLDEDGICSVCGGIGDLCFDCASEQDDEEAGAA